jgi:hypothetical protein
VWNIKGPPVVKLFLWKACNNILATNENLHKRRVVTTPLCTICGLETETVGHILWSCPSARDVWTECAIRIQKCTSDDSDFMELLTKMLNRLDGDEMAMVAVVARQLWLRRNTVAFGGDFLSPSQVTRIALAQLEAYRQAEQSRLKQTIQNRGTEVEIWQRPPSGFIKLNCDAAIDKPGNRMGI